MFNMLSEPHLTMYFTYNLIFMIYGDLHFEQLFIACVILTHVIYIFWTVREVYIGNWLVTAN